MGQDRTEARLKLVQRQAALHVVAATAGPGTVAGLVPSALVGRYDPIERRRPARDRHAAQIAPRRRSASQSVLLSPLPLRDLGVQAVTAPCEAPRTSAVLPAELLLVGRQHDPTARAPLPARRHVTYIATLRPRRHGPSRRHGAGLSRRQAGSASRFAMFGRFSSFDFPLPPGNVKSNADVMTVVSGVLPAPGVLVAALASHA